VNGLSGVELLSRLTGVAGSEEEEDEALGRYQTQVVSTDSGSRSGGVAKTPIPTFSWAEIPQGLGVATPLVSPLPPQLVCLYSETLSEGDALA